MRGKQLLALAGALCLVLTACRTPGETPATPTPSPTPAVQTPAPSALPAFSLPVDPAGEWDPYEGSRGGNLTLAPLLYEGLFALDRTFTPQNVLARAAVPSEDGLTWTVTLQEGVTFSDGTALTAQTVWACLDRARGEKSLYRARFRDVRQMGWEGETTLTFTLSAPNAGFPALLDVPIALTAKTGVVGTGPYVLGDGALMAREDWWQGKPLPLDAIPLLEISDAGALVAAFQAGTLGLTVSDPTGSDPLGYSGSYQSWEYPTSQMFYLGFCCTRGPCADAAFRLAVSRCVDRSALATQTLEGHAAAAALPVPPGSRLHDSALTATLDYDPSAASAALDELGYGRNADGVRQKGGKDVTLTLLVNSDNLYKGRLAQAVAESLAAVGVPTEVKSLAWEEYKKALEQGEFDLYLAECRLTGDLDPSGFLTSGSGLSYGGFSDNELRAALAQARATGEWGDFYARWAETVPLAVLGFKNAYLLTQWGQVAGARPTQGNLFYGIENWSVS